MFPSPGILQHYVKFNTRTLITLEKLLGVRSFGGSNGYLAHCQTTLIVSLGDLGFLFLVQTIVLAFLGHWVLIILAFFICFQQDDYLILLDVVTHVESYTSLFQITLQDAKAMTNANIRHHFTIDGIHP